MMSKGSDREASKERRSLPEYFERTWAQIEKSVEEAVQRSLAKVKVPRREQLQDVRTRLDRLEARLKALEAKRG